MRILAVSSYASFNSKFNRANNNRTPHNDVVKPNQKSSISFKSYESIFKNVDVSKFMTTAEVEKLFYDLRSSLISEGLYDAGKKDIFGKNLSEAFKNISKIFKDSSDVCKYRPQNGKTYIAIDCEEINMYYPCKENAEYTLGFSNHSSDFNPNALSIFKTYPSGNTYYMDFWKSTGNRKAFSDPAGNRNIYYKRDGKPDWIQNFLFG